MSISFHLLYFTCSYVILYILQESVIVNAEEYCQSEIFAPSCQSDEVILITSAHYGRMKFGKCVEKELEFEAMWSNRQYIGCNADVLEFVSQKCTGKKQCALKVPDKELEKKNPCYSSLKMYLDVIYSCLKVAQNNRQCTISLSTDIPMYVQNPQNQESCGTKEKPWMIEALKGQKIMVSMLNINNKSAYKQENKPIMKSSNFCPVDQVIGFVVDRFSEHRTNKTICGTELNAGSIVSASNAVEASFVKISEAENRILFLQLEAIGCSDLIPPADAWLKRTENEAIIGCYSTRLRWQLKCQGQRWIGVIGNCSYVQDNIPMAIKSDKKASVDHTVKENNSQVFTITIICAIGIVLCSFIVCIGIVCLKRYSQKSKLAESILKEKQILSNGSMLRPVGYQPYQNHQLDDKHMENGSCDNDQGQYFVLDEKLTASKDETI